MSNKRYYWLKLNENFFEDDTVAWIEEQDNGKDYIIFYLKLCLKSLTDDGYLIRYVGEKLIPYDVKALSKLTNTDYDTVRVAMNLFLEVGIISQLDSGELYLNQINEMIGSETDAAQRKRKQRAREAKLETVNQDKLEMRDNVTEVSQVGHTEIEIEKELDKEIDIDKEIDSKDNKQTKKTRHKYGDNQNVLMTKEEYDKLSEKFPNDLEKRINNLSYYMASTGKSYKSHYMTIIAWARRDKEKTNTQNEPLDLDNVFDEMDNSDQWARWEERKNASNR